MNEINVYKKNLEQLRKEIDLIDDKIIELLNIRGDISQKVGNLKKLISLEILQPQREIEIINRMTDKSKVLKNSSIKAIWKEIMEACKLIQEI